MIEDFLFSVISLVSFCSHLSCLLVSSSGAETVLFQQMPIIGLIFNLSRAIHARQHDSVRTVCRYGRGVQVRPGQFWQHMRSWWIRKSWGWMLSILLETLTVCCCQWLQQFTEMEWRSQQCAEHLKQMCTTRFAYYLITWNLRDMLISRISRLKKIAKLKWREK